MPGRSTTLAFCLMGSVAFTWYAVMIYPKRSACLRVRHESQDPGIEVGSGFVAVSELLDPKGVYMPAIDIPVGRLSLITNDLSARGVDTVEVRLFYREAFRATSLQECVEYYCKLLGRELEGDVPERDGYSMVLVSGQLSSDEQVSLIEAALPEDIALVPVGEKRVRVVEMEPAKPKGSYVTNSPQSQVSGPE